MHEFALAENIFDTCMKTAERYHAKKIVEIHLELGDFTLTNEELLANSFHILTKDSIASDAKFIIKRTPGVLKCNECGKSSEIWFEEEKQKEETEDEKNGLFGNLESSVHSTSGYQLFGLNLFQCKFCGSRNTDLTGGKEVKVKNIKITDETD